MEGYNHYIRVDESNNIIFGFSNAFEQPQQGDIQLSGDFGRHFTIQLLNERGQYKFKVVEGQITPRTQQELDEEWSQRSPEPPSLEQQLSDLQDVVNVLIMGGI